MRNHYLLWGGVLGALAVMLGAFGAHSLKEVLTPESLAVFQTGVQYQMYHSLALLAVGILYDRLPGKWLRWSGLLFLTGILLFSGSLYLLTAFKAAGTVGINGIGIITPFGGLSFIAGWICLCIASAGKR